MIRSSFRARIAVEFAGTAFLLMAIIGSGIMAAKLSGGNVGLALLANALATAAALYVLILTLGPFSGAHFNPLVSALMAIRGQMGWSQMIAYAMAQLVGAVVGTWLTHLMFDMSIFQLSTNMRHSVGHGVSEVVASFGLLMTILLSSRAKPESTPAAVALFIGSAYWFTASTSFANPAVTLARCFTDSFAGIRLMDAPWFWIAQLAGLALAALVMRNMDAAEN